MIKILVLLLIFLPINNSYSAEKEYSRAIGPYDWNFPRDHGAHPEFQTEWWYFTGHLEAGDSTYGFELTTFRAANPTTNNVKSKWAADQIYLTHFTITDEINKKFYKYELVNRNSFNLAGASKIELDVRNGSYHMYQENNKLNIKAKNKEIELILKLDLDTKIVLNGKDGLSQKGQEPGNASYYYSIPRLFGNGILKIKNEIIQIDNASVWMDREFFTIENPQNNGWDWFSIQFDDGSNLMIYQIRDENNNPTEFSSGTYSDSSGNFIILNPKDFELIIEDYWKSKKTKIKYPLIWNINIPKLNIEIQTSPTMNNQELVLDEILDMTYWEGRCLVSGSHKGKAYMELVGY